MSGKRARRRVTLADVAKAAGVSRSLASLALRGEGGVRPETRARILKVAKRVNYHPNLIARNLASATTRSIGVLVGEVLNPFHAQIARELDLMARGAGFDILLAINADTQVAAEHSLATLVAQRVAGLILIGSPLNEGAIVHAGTQAPTVCIGRHLPAINVESVTTDDLQGAIFAVEHLIELGHRRIVHIDGGNGPGAQRRREGYHLAMARHGLSDQELVVAGGYTLDAGSRAAAAIFAKTAPPLAVFAANDLAAIGVLNEANRHKLSVPAEVSVVGYDDIALAGTETLSLTTVHQPADRLAKEGIDSLMARIGNPSSPPMKKLITPCLVVRRTTGAPAMGATPP